MRTYTQLTQEQRYQVYALLKMGHNQTEIATVGDVDKLSYYQVRVIPKPAPSGKSPCRTGSRCVCQRR